MGKAAILIGNTQYQSLQDLPCCQNDVEAMKELLAATAKFPTISVITDAAADDMKEGIRAVVDVGTAIDELFFYFTGHGYQHEDDFFLCATDFHRSNPNSTGLSTDELHVLLREASADLVVKVIDSCNSGKLLVKADSSFQAPQAKFNNLIQISSCRENQDSLAGEPLSVFTGKFREAALRKPDGPVYYMDIVNSLRDTFIQNNEQTPFFVFQVTGRETFVDDAHRLDALRNQVMANAHVSAVAESGQQPPAAPGIRQLLEVAEQGVATPERIEAFVDGFFDTLIREVSDDEFSQFYDLDVVEHSDFIEPTAEGFIIRLLSRQERFDEFVTASIKKERVQGRLGLLGTAGLLGMFPGDQRFREVYDLELNCRMKRAQLKFTFVPRYHSLKKLVAVVTCAPSLHLCYILELGTQHKLTDFNEFGIEGKEIVRRWYKLTWTDNVDGVVAKITSRLHQVVKEHLEETEQRLAGEGSETG